MEKTINIHIGQLVKTVFDRSGLSVSELARRISVERTTVYSIFERPSIDVIQLIKISVALNYNFLYDIECSSGMVQSIPQLTIHIDSLSPDVVKRMAGLLEESQTNNCRK